MVTFAPALHDLRIIQGSNWGRSFRVLSGGYLMDFTNYAYTARAKVRPAIDQSTVLSMTTANGLLAVGYDPPLRRDFTAYAVGQQILPINIGDLAARLNGFIYECTVGGTTGGGGGPYPTTLGATFTDGSVTWVCKRADTAASNVRILLSPTDTDPLTDWGLGVWDLELIDPYGHVARIVEGSCVLSRQVTR